MAFERYPDPLEPETDAVAREVNVERCLVSLSISAKRIADALERIAERNAPEPEKNSRDYIGMPHGGD